MLIRFVAMPSDQAAAYRAGADDANGMPPERGISDGDGIPCRHCLQHVRQGEPYLTLAYRPFPRLQPYAESGPIFLHAEECTRAPESDVLPDMYRGGFEQIVRGYGHNDRIVYGTGAVVAPLEICTHAYSLLERPDIAYVHIRSSRNNCYSCRIERG
ncbi:DUF1203 domain-containing protein [Mesorhizobium sp. NBSH29]|uniref:DUF1203 domain-containing protein n=1 Tax=Mesorhizobium sp. NBSH29 TaxID=2654249 RepID=UPI0018965686|nr:DUF1203 domain-containing protein [Mesorhizobium sp. NBSH29]QPC87535.1 DUF1203 domain-containing protein [Mesorhizobium sp. NBSH29]